MKSQAGWYVVEIHDDNKMTLGYWESYIWCETAQAEATRMSGSMFQFTVCYYDGYNWRR